MTDKVPDKVPELNPPVVDATPAAAAVPAVEVKKFTPLVDMIDMEDSSGAIDPTTVFNKDPNYYYCWLSTDTRRLEYNKAVYGFELVGLKDKESTFSPPNALGERRLGDVVLAKIPMERYERLMERHKRKTIDGMRASHESWKAAIEASGMQVAGEIFKAEKKVGM